MNWKKSLLGACAMSLAFSSFASTAVSKADLGRDPYFKIKEVKVREIKEFEVPFARDLRSLTLLEQQMSGGELGEVLAVADQLIAFGEKVYTIIKKGKPVVNLSWAPVSVLPKEAGKNIDPMDMEDWEWPKSKKYEITYVNGFNMDVVKFTYSVNLVYGGTFNGKGKYITGAEIVPENVSVAWGYTFDASMKVVSIVNKGKKASPIAGVTLQLSYNVSTVIKEDRNNVSYFLTGDGQIREL